MTRRRFGGSTPSAGTSNARAPWVVDDPPVQEIAPEDHSVKITGLEPSRARPVVSKGAIQGTVD